MRDLHGEKDGGWMSVYPAPDQRIALGEVGVHGQGTDLAIVTYGNGYYLSRQAARILGENKVRVIDLRWLAPLPEEALMLAIDGCKSILVVDECRRSGNVSEALMTLLAERLDLPAHRVAAEDSFIATGPAYAATMPSTDQIVQAAGQLLKGGN